MRVSSHSGPLSGAIDVTGSKSWTNRALIIAGAAAGPSTLHNYLRSEDSYWCIESLRSLGAEVTVEPNKIEIVGTGGRWQTSDKIYIGSAGTTARFLTSVLAFSVREALLITASQQMYARPMAELLRVLTELGAKISYDGQDQCLPLRLQPATESGGLANISGALSSQFVSGTLIGAPYAHKPVSLSISDHIVQENYVRMTVDAMKSFGADINASADLSKFDIAPKPYTGTDYTIEADASTASYFGALAAVTGGDILIRRLAMQTLQPDIEVLSIFKKFGCEVVPTSDGIRVIGPKQLQGGFSVDLNSCSDMALTVAAISPFASAPVEITGVEHIRAHESDRVAVMAEALTQMGIRVEERRDGWLIHPGQPSYQTLSTHHDHRVAMSLAVIAVAGNGLELLNPACVSKTCPVFFDLLQQLGVETQPS